MAENLCTGLKSMKKRLCTYNKESPDVKDVISVTLHYRDQVDTLKLIVVGPNLLVQDWLHVIRLDWQILNTI